MDKELVKRVADIEGKFPSLASIRDLKTYETEVLRKLDEGELMPPNSGVPPIFHCATLSNFEGYQVEKRKACEALLNNRWIFITGQVGTGKSHLMAALLRERLKMLLVVHHLCLRDEFEYEFSCTPMWLSEKTYVDRIRREVRENYGDTMATEIIGQYVYLFYDDLANCRIDERIREEIGSLVDSRYERQLQTVFTSNLNLERVGKELDDRTASRIAERAVVIHLAGDDYRLKKASRKE